MKPRNAKERAGRKGLVDPLFGVAQAQLDEGKVAEAEATARRLVARAPRNAKAHVLLATVQRRRGKPHDAVVSFREALAIDPGNGWPHYLLGCALREAKRDAEAEFAFKDAIAADPKLADAHLDLGNLYFDQKQFVDAENAYRQAIAAQPSFATAHYNLGNVLRETGRPEEAAAAYHEALQRKEDYPDAWYNLGLCELKRERLEAAIAANERAIELRPDFALAHHNLGTVFSSLGRLDEAEQAFRKALSIKELALPHHGLGRVFEARSKPAEAAAAYRRSIALDPAFFRAQLDLADLLARRGNDSEAEQIYQAVLAKSPSGSDTRIECLQAFAWLLRSRGRLSEAVDCYDRLRRARPSHPEALSGLCLAKSQICDWRNRDEEFEELLRLTGRQIPAGDRSALTALDAMARPVSPAQHLAMARSWADDTKRQMAVWRERLDFRFDRERRHDRLRVGYVSQDFRDHAISHLIRGVFGLHDRTQIEVFRYAACRDDGSIYRKTIAESCEHFVDIDELSVVEAAKRIVDDEIDILVDVMGYTAHARMGIIALHPAPVVLGFLQVPGTSGADFIDYMLTDCVVTTPDDQRYYSEQLVFLPNCYQPNDWKQEIDQTPVTRADCGLPEDTFVYCCFNNNYKIEPFIFAVWMRILHRVPNSVLWLLRLSPQMESNLVREAEARGIPAHRLVFADKISKARHLARQKLADLFLDTRYYTAHTTASDALWGGLPILTCPGDTFASRVSASILHAAGLPELIVPDFEAYKWQAVHFANHPEELKAIRDKWAAQRTSCALFDTGRFVRNLERAYRMIWDDYCAGIPPRQLFVTEE
jgi:protein O-GlcNAc transferase